MFNEILTLLITVLSILTGIFAEIRTTVIHEMKAIDLNIFSSLKHLERCGKMKQKVEKDIIKKYLETSTGYVLTALYISFVALYTLSAVISSGISFLALNILKGFLPCHHKRLNRTLRSKDLTASYLRPRHKS
jgi:hypothetical protein